MDGGADRLVVLLASPPGSSAAGRALGILRRWRERGGGEGAATLALIEDATPLAAAPARVEGARIFVLDEHAKMRGIPLTDLPAATEVGGYGDLADLLLGDRTRVIGAL